MTQSTVYDEVRYSSYPYALTHPDRLATVAALHGLSSPDPATARVLEMLADAASALARAQADSARHHDAALAAAREQGFTTLEAVRAAVLDDESRLAYQQAVTAHDEALREAEAVLADPDLVAVTDGTIDVETAVEALESGVPPREVWLTLCAAMDVPENRRHGRQDPRRP